MRCGHAQQEPSCHPATHAVTTPALFEKLHENKEMLMSRILPFHAVLTSYPLASSLVETGGVEPSVTCLSVSIIFISGFSRASLFGYSQIFSCLLSNGH